MSEQAMISPQEIKDAVTSHYAAAAVQAVACCDGGGCCRPTTADFVDGLSDVPSLGCGTPVEAAELQPGETVLDLGSGRGLDVFRAAERVGHSGAVIGVDMTPEMVGRARRDADRLGYPQVEFRLGEIEALPVGDRTVDVVISNCVINLVPDKSRVFTEAFRVLRPGGRLIVSDMVRRGSSRPRAVDARRWAACMDGAEAQDEYLDRIHQAGFTDIAVIAEADIDLSPSPSELNTDLRSITVRASRPG